MGMGGGCLLMRHFAVFMGSGRVLLGLRMFADIMVMRGLVVVVGRSMMMRCRGMVMLARGMFR